MELLERIWDLVGYVLSGTLRAVERAITSVFGSSNARFIRKLQPKIDAISSLEPKYQAMSDQQLREQTAIFREGWRQAKPWTIC